MIAQLILTLVLVYLLCGFIFIIPFMIKGIVKVDEGTRGSSWGFRLVIAPGIIVLWPLLLKKWMIAGKREKIKSR
ncbi:MAG: hypothetical protein ABI760_15225 [Ferruginibacter sp.]